MSPARRFLFPGAGDGAPAPIRQFVAWVRRLPAAQRARQSLLWRMLGPGGTPPYKYTPPEVAYVWPSRTPGQTCANCQAYYPHALAPICSEMRCKVYPEDHCNQWTPLISAAEYIAYQGGDAREWPN